MSGPTRVLPLVLEVLYLLKDRLGLHLYTATQNHQNDEEAYSTKQ